MGRPAHQRLVLERIPRVPLLIQQDQGFSECQMGLRRAQRGPLALASAECTARTVGERSPGPAARLRAPFRRAEKILRSFWVPWGIVGKLFDLNGLR